MISQRNVSIFIKSLFQTSIPKIFLTTYCNLQTVNALLKRLGCEIKLNKAITKLLEEHNIDKSVAIESVSHSRLNEDVSGRKSYVKYLR